MTEVWFSIHGDMENTHSGYVHSSQTHHLLPQQGLCTSEQNMARQEILLHVRVLEKGLGWKKVAISSKKSGLGIICGFHLSALSQFLAYILNLFLLSPRKDEMHDNSIPLASPLLPLTSENEKN